MDCVGSNPGHIKDFFVNEVWGTCMNSIIAPFYGACRHEYKL